MWRVAPAIVLLALIVLVFVFVVPALVRRHVQKTRESARQEQLAEYQQRTAIDDLDKTRARINAGLDQHYQDRDEALKEEQWPPV